MMDETGGYCAMCDTVWAAPARCKCDAYKIQVRGSCGKLHGSFKDWQECAVCRSAITPNETLIQELTVEQIAKFAHNSVFAKAMWNAAIEAAMKACDVEGDYNPSSYYIEAIIKLKK